MTGPARAPGDVLVHLRLRALDGHRRPTYPQLMGLPEVTLVGLLLAGVAGTAWLLRTRLRRGDDLRSAARRPIEEIARDVRRRGERFHALSPHASFVKVSALRSAYDHVLGECCDSLGHSHLLTVLQPGPELDRERRRVELVLHSFGLPVHHAA